MPPVDAQRVLYFDLDGTLIRGGFGDVKACLSHGGFERAVRAARFDRLVCVANAVAIVHALEELGRQPDGHEMIFQLSFGALHDLPWFRRVTTLVEDPRRRARYIDMRGSWWWVDDLARHYLALEGLPDVYRAHQGGRIFEPAPDGDGRDVLDWLESIPGRAERATPC